VIALLDVGGTKLAAAVAGPPGEGLGRVRRVPTPDVAPISTLVELIDGVREDEPLEMIAMSVPGPFDREAGSLRNPPGMPSSWHFLGLRAQLGALYGCPVVVENDANCAALAEARSGAGRGARTVVYITVSTGIGTGVIRDGAIVVSRQDTEGGHQVVWPESKGGPTCHCGGAGCLEALASGAAIERRFGVRAELLDDPLAWADIGRWLGLGVVNVTTLLDPDAVIFGGGVCAAWSRFEPVLRATVAAHVHLQPVPAITLGELGEERSLLGALAVAGRW
jgi:glucokinase